MTVTVYYYDGTKDEFKDVKWEAHSSYGFLEVKYSDHSVFLQLADISWFTVK